MCERHPERDERGRLLPGHTANPNGRPRVGAYARLLAAAEAAGAEVVVMVPPRRPRPSDEPPRAA